MPDEPVLPQNGGGEEGYYSMVQMANDGILVIQDNEIVMANPTLARMLDYKDKELIGLNFSDILDPVASHLFTEKQEKFAWGQADRPSFRARFLNKRKQPVIVETSTADFVFNGKPAILVVVRDIKEKIDLEAAMERSELRYKTLYDSSPIAYFTLTQRGIVQQVNNAAETLLGYNREDMLRRSFSSLLPEEDSEEFSNQLLSEVIQGKEPKDFEMQMKRSDGQKIWVSVTADLLRDTEKQSNIGVMVLDIDRRKLAEERMNAERDRANLYLEIMTHDLNNVNQSILFAIGLLENELDIPDNLKSKVDETSWNVRRAARMIANMRAIITLKDAPPSKKKIDVYHLFQSAADTVDQDFPWKRLRIESNITEGEYEVSAHEFLYHVFFNILHNSMMFDENNVVDVSVNAGFTKYRDSVRIEISDNGPGIPDNLKEPIFKRTGSPTSQIVGRGLGLTLVDKIITNLGGDIWVEDRVKGDQSKGAKFVVILPRWAEQVELPCGRNTCITFYKSNHCLFCDPAWDILLGVLSELGVPPCVVEQINVDDPSADMSEDELPMLPFIKICDSELSGFVADDAVRSSILGLLMKPCYPEL